MPNYARKRRMVIAGLAFICSCLLVEACFALIFFAQKLSTEREAAASRDHSILLRLRLERYRQDAAIRRRTERIRGLTFKRPVPSEIMSRDEIQEFLLEKMGQAYTDEELAGYELALKLLGAIPESADFKKAITKLYSSQAGGFYDHREKVLYRIAGMPLKNVILAHEYTHALQDQNLGLSSLPLDEKDNDDRAIAALCLVEGDAMLVTKDYSKQHAGIQAALGAASSMFSASEGLGDAPEFFVSFIQFPYVEGTRFVQTAHRRGGWKAVDRLYSDPPDSSEQIIHPEKYFNTRDLPQAVETRIGLAGLKGLFPGQWRVSYRNVMGEGAILILLEQYVKERTAMIAAAGWGGDRYSVFQSAERTVLSWSTVWDSRRDALEFVSAVRRMISSSLARDASTVRSNGLSVWIDEGNSAAVRVDGAHVHIVRTRKGSTLRAILPLLVPGPGTKEVLP